MKTKVVRFGVGLAILANAGAPAFAVCASPSTQLTDVGGTGGPTVVTLTFVATLGGHSGETIILSIGAPNVTATKSGNGNTGAATNAAAFDNFVNSNVPPVSGDYTFVGTVNGWNSGPVVNTNQVVFTSVATGTPPFTITGTGTTLFPTISVAPSLPSVSGLLTGNTACVGTPPTAAPGAPWTNQEFHQSGGALIDWKLGVTNPDPTKTIGTWSIGGSGATTAVTYSYNGSGGGTYTVWKNTDGSYSFCTGTTVIANATIKSGQGACP